MARPESPTALGHCPTDEELAAFLDGMLSPAERARITAHLAECESCYEIFSGAVRFQQDEVLSEVPAAAGRIVPFPAKQEREERRGKTWWVGAAAAAVVVAGIGFFEYPILFSSKLSTADIESKPIPAKDFYRYAQYRGGDDHLDSLADDAPRFMVGVLLVDISLDSRQGNIDPERYAEVGRKLKKVNFAEVEAQAFMDRAEKLRSGDPAAKQEIVKSLPKQDAELEESLGLPNRFGKWSEAGRLAAVTRTPGFFSRGGNERFLAKLLKEPISRDEGVAEHLAAIQTITDRGVREADFSPLAQHFTEIIRHYDI